MWILLIRIMEIHPSLYKKQNQIDIDLEGSLFLP